ncbi:hypothetical protein PRIPAC_78233 [Pristionchus pacificus]|uniref:Uncharacterized protein n=1 Tax=Pristionchus pacificus TaxID=54126 RepID=A0A2A6CKR6_PRIPA|nr:hypothetical protein PRIPAC_78233 [Pristionchus pacificus]|eukprot:PDM78643.1 hypothetical protein PRIPAC_31222 [Pristionchus pacificus]
MMQSVTLLHLLATTALVAEPAPLVAGAAPKFDVLFINDFTLNFVNDGAKLAEKSTKCPGNAYPEAAEQFSFTSSVVDAIDASINLLTLQYDFYNGGNGHHLNGYLFTKDNFVADAGQVFRNFCFEQPQTSDLPTYVKTKLVHARDVDVLVLFTAASAAELAAALPIDADEFKAVIVVGLRVEFEIRGPPSPHFTFSLTGADASSFYPSTFIAIDDFGHPEDVAGMINNAYADIRAA